MCVLVCLCLYGGGRADFEWCYFFLALNKVHTKRKVEQFTLLG